VPARCHSGLDPESRNFLQKPMKQYFVYILSNKRNGTLYIGVTNNLVRRVYEHKNDVIDGFTKKYKVHNLVYFEQYEEIELALNREKQLKFWQRRWKLELIETNNPDWKDLYDDLIESGFWLSPE
jgi:putative endonuclease